MKNAFLGKSETTNMEEIENLISELDVVLPMEYKLFLNHINGGCPAKGYFELRKFDPDATNLNSYVIVDEFFSFSQLRQVWNYTKDDLAEFYLFPIAEIRGGMLICCKQADDDEAETYFYDNNFGILKLTDSLSDLFENLVTKEEVDYRKYGLSFEP